MGGFEGIVRCLSPVYAGLAQVLNEINVKTVLPV
jgi:succinate-acetate transporter protein